MSSLDFRTRSDADIHRVDARAFFVEQLPEQIERNAGFAAAGAAELGVAPLAVGTPAGDWTLARAGRSFSLTPGPDAPTLVRLGDDDVSDLVNDLKTPMTLLTAGRLDLPRGRLGDLLDWWVVLRALIDGRPAHTRGAVAFRARDGAPLDLRRSFTPDDDDAEIAHFLAEAGFVHLRGWFAPELMDEIARDMDAALPRYRRGDGESWWARTAAGEDRCVRMQGFDRHSRASGELLASERFARIGALPGDGHEARATGNRIEALIKPIGVVEGISDVPWHKDCSLGMHSYRCCSLTVGISVTGADARSGQLRVVAGSHRALVRPAFVRPDCDLPVLDLPTETGDATVHCSCTLHMAQPPVERERRVMYTGFALPERGAASDDRRRALGEIGRVREGAYTTVSQAPGHLGGREA
jgi:hypothetical protein